MGTENKDCSLALIFTGVRNYTVNTVRKIILISSLKPITVPSHIVILVTVLIRIHAGSI